MKGFLSKVLKLFFAVLLIVNTIPVHLNAAETEEPTVQEEIVTTTSEQPTESPEPDIPKTETEDQAQAPPAVQETASSVEESVKKEETAADKEQPVADSASAKKATDGLNQEAADQEETEDAKNAEQGSAVSASIDNDSVTDDSSKNDGSQEPVYYEVHFFIDGVEDKTLLIRVEAGTAIGEQMPTDPEKENYDFDGWFDAKNNEVTKETVVEAEINANAKFTEKASQDSRETTAEKIVTIQYVAGEGGGVTSKEEKVDVLKDGFVVSGSSAAADEGYVFVNWTDAEGNEISTEAEFKPVLTSESTDAVYTANFEVESTEANPAKAPQGETEEAEKFTVTFKVGDTEYAVVNDVEEGTLIADILPETDPTVTEGYRFGGWNYTDGQTVTEDATIIAKDPIQVFTVTFVNRDGETTNTLTVDAGEKITMPAVIEREDYTAYWAVGTATSGQSSGFTPEQRIGKEGATYTVEKDVTIGPDYDQIVYTITFYKEDKTTVVDTKQVNSDTSYCLNDIPAVPAKDGYSGKWVYEKGDFTNQVSVKADTKVWPEYDQNVFTVTYKVDGETYETDTYYKDDELTLPVDPVVEGKEFAGWYIGETEYKGGEAVISDLILTAKLIDEYYVNFIIKIDGEESERLSQYFRTAGEAIGTMPQDPFVAGKIFDKWVIEDTETVVTADTIVTGNMTVVAVFHEVTVYDITAEYYYFSDSGKEVIFNTDLIQVEEHELPYTITAPSTTQTDPDEVSGAPIYYPETPTVTVDKSDFTDHASKVRFKYVPFTAEYDFVYKLKDLSGEGYTEIPDSREHVHGVLNSFVTPTVKPFDYANLELAEGAIITQAEGQELSVLYTRKNFQVSYETNGGSYVGGATAPYGSDYTLSTVVPTRVGYTFGGWYLDEELTQEAGSSITVEGNTTLYAKWNPDTVHYTIVYMFEKYNDAGTESSYVYDNSRDATGQVGSTVQASTAPTLTKTGWEKDAEKNATSSVIIAADGSSVLLVYYKLTEYTFIFHLDGTYYRSTYWGGSWETYNNFAATMTKGGRTYNQSNNPAYSFKAKLGQDISSLWPSSATGSYRNGWGPTQTLNLFGWKKDSPRISTSQDLKQNNLTTGLIPDSGTSVTFYSSWTTGTTRYSVNIYLQNANDDNYTLSEKYSQTFYGDSGIAFYHDPINGYIYNEDKSTPDGQNQDYDRTTWNIYYDLEKYSIEYYYLSTDLDNSKTVKFGADISDPTFNWIPTASQCGVDSDYTFDGWYSDNGLTSKYSFGTMPANNLVLYAKWSAPSYTVSFVDGENTSTKLFDDETVEKYKKATNPGTPSKEGYVFDGWYTTASGNDLYDWNNQIIENTTVYAHWSKETLSYKVHYVDEEGVSVAPDKTVTNPNFTVGQNIIEQAIAVAGYRPDKSSDTLTLSSRIEENELTFVYSLKADSTGYTVRYVIANGETGAGFAVAEEKTVENVAGNTASVIELAAAVNYSALYVAHPELQGVEFFPDEVEKTLVLSSDAEKNVLTFYYSSFKSSKVTVNFVDMNGDPIHGEDTEILKVGKTYTLARTPIAGWELYTAVEGDSIDGQDNM